MFLNLCLTNGSIIDYFVIGMNGESDNIPNIKCLTPPILEAPRMTVRYAQ